MSVLAVGIVVLIVAAIEVTYIAEGLGKKKVEKRT
jgi:hypothetical protein